MKVDSCNCGNTLSAVAIYHSPKDNKCAFNLYLCNKCGNIYKECIFENKGIFVLQADNTFELKKGE